ncbi:MAG TPA: polysaccharide biosynthesis C-terminal domain-containing protein [Candidatus Sulfotelmatobacter sp.]|nr:polysaccharide biosynthesis C-terminal domain-containing protein [Candidatus Sulfotelmatobacter sp.]
MRKLEKLEIIKNVGSSWFALAVNIVVGVFISPFILHRLGDTAFGLWVLIFSLTGYYGIFDFGIRSSIVRYVSKYTATRDIQEVNGLINTAMFTYSGVGIVSLLITLAGCLYIDRLFKIPANFHSTAAWLLLIVGTSVAVGFPLGVFGGMLEGLQKFYIINWTNIVFSGLVRAGLIVFFLSRGYGLLTVAIITVGLPIVSSLVRAAVALRSLPIKFRWKYVDRKSFRHMANYSGVTFMVIIAARLRLKSDAVVIGTFLSSAAITYFYAGSRLVDYAGEVVSSLAQIFVPMSSQSDAAGNIDRLRKIFIVGNRACALTIFPITVFFVILGKSIIGVWLGQKYVALAYPVLIVLIIPHTIMQIQSASGRILFGMSKHSKLAIISLIEGIANIVLSILMVRPWGIMGDALGTAIPLLCTYVVFMPRHLCSLLRVRMWTYLRQAYELPLLLCTPMIVVLLLLQRWVVPHSYRQLIPQLLIGGLVYSIGLAWAYKSNRVLQIGNFSKPAAPVQLQPVASVVEGYSEEV